MPLDHFLNDILEHNVMLVVLCRVVSMCPGVTPSSFPVAGYSEASLIPTPILARIIDSTYALTGIRGFATVMSYQAVFVRGGHLKTYTVKMGQLLQKFRANIHKTLYRLPILY